MKTNIGKEAQASRAWVAVLLFFAVAASASGEVQEAWRRSFDAGSNDGVNAMGVDAAGNVYVAGYSINTNDFTQDFVTIKYSPSGTPLWERRYAGAAEGNNSPWPWQ